MLSFKLKMHKPVSAGAVRSSVRRRKLYHREITTPREPVGCGERHTLPRTWIHPPIPNESPSAPSASRSRRRRFCSVLMFSYEIHAWDDVIIRRGKTVCAPAHWHHDVVSSAAAADIIRWRHIVVISRDGWPGPPTFQMLPPPIGSRCPIIWRFSRLEDDLKHRSTACISDDFVGNTWHLNNR